MYQKSDSQPPKFPISTCYEFGAVAFTKTISYTICATKTEFWFGRISCFACAIVPLAMPPLWKMWSRKQPTTSNACAITQALPCGAETTKFWQPGLDGAGNKKKKQKAKKTPRKYGKSYTDIFPSHFAWSGCRLRSGVAVIGTRRLAPGWEIRRTWTTVMIIIGAFWWGKDPFKMYATHIARFMSEYGFQSFPEMKTVKTICHSGRLWHFLRRDEIASALHRSETEPIEYYMLQDYKKPKNFESFLYVNHVLQAEGIKFALEGHRRRRAFLYGKFVLANQRLLASGIVEFDRLLPALESFAVFRQEGFWAGNSVSLHHYWFCLKLTSSTTNLLN